MSTATRPVLTFVNGATSKIVAGGTDVKVPAVRHLIAAAAAATDSEGSARLPRRGAFTSWGGTPAGERNFVLFPLADRVKHVTVSLGMKGVTT